MKDYSDKSFWLATSGDYLPNPAITGDLKVDIAIIGGGYTGFHQQTTCVRMTRDYRLRSKKAKSLVLEPAAEMAVFP